MGDPRISSDDVTELVQTYFSSRERRPVPPDLADRAFTYAYDGGRRHGRRFPALAAGGAATAAAAAAITLTLVFSGPSQPQPPGSPTSVAVTRTGTGLSVSGAAGSGGVRIAKRQVVERLWSDLHSLPTAPASCAGSDPAGALGYVLTFSLPDGRTATASLHTVGCERVQLTGSPERSAADSPRLWSDLAAALGLPVDEVAPSPR